MVDRNLINVYLTASGEGGGQAKSVAFFVLVPISYLLLLSALLVIVSRFYQYTFHVACLFLLLCVVVFEFIGLHTYVELLTIGMLGVTAGYVPIERVNSLVRHPYLLAVAYLLYLGAITIWNVIYPLQIVGVCLSLMIIYLLGQKSGEPGEIRACIVLLGKYSLVGYIAQIAILQLLHVGLNHIHSEAVVLGLSFVLAFALTIVSVEILDRVRAQSVTIDKLYKTVFA